MKILHVYKDFDPPVHGGIERHIALMCRYQRQWADVEALTCSRRVRSRSLDRDGTRVMEVGEWGRFQNAPLSPAFPWWLRKKAADVIVVHVPNPTAELAWLMARPAGTLVVRYHSDIVRQATALRLYRPWQQRFLSRADLILPTSQQYLDTSESLAPHRDRCRVVPLGIVPEDLPAPDSACLEAVRARYGGAFVLFTGRHRYYKGLHHLVEAARDIEAPVVIAGDGPERGRLMELARSLGAAVHFPGNLDQESLAAHLHACALFVFPSIARSEAFGMAIMEAHACGKAAVATELGTGVEFINEHGKTGLNVPPHDPCALAAAANRLLRDPETRASMGAYAAGRIRIQFHAARIAEVELGLFEEAAAGRGATCT